MQAPMLVQLPNPSACPSAPPCSTPVLLASGRPCGNRAYWLTLAPMKSMAAAFGQAATHAPQPMQVAAIEGLVGIGFGTGMALASTSVAAGVDAHDEPPAAWMMRSKALRSTTRVRSSGRPAAPRLDGDRLAVLEAAHVQLAGGDVFSGPCASPEIIRLHMPQMPSRQSWSKAIGLLPSALSFAR
jgi:hypothetical protein